MAGQNPPPETEVRLQELQRDFLQPVCSKQVRDEFFLLLRVYARSITLKEIKRKGVVLPPERVDEISTDATLLLLNQYNKEGWRVEASFAGVLRWKVVEALYSKANDDMNYSLNRTFSEDDNKELLSIVSNNENPFRDSYSELEEDPGDLVVNSINVASDEVSNLIDQAYEILPYNTFLRFLPWILLQLRKPKLKNIQTMFKSLFISSKEEAAFELLLMELRNRIYMLVK